MDGCNCSFKKVTQHVRVGGSRWSCKRSQYIWKNEWPVVTHLEWMLDCKWCFEKNLYKRLMLQIDPLNSNCSQKLQYPPPPTPHPPKKVTLNQILQKNSSLVKVAVPKVTLESANVFNCCPTKFTILDE